VFLVEGFYIHIARSEKRRELPERFFSHLSVGNENSMAFPFLPKEKAIPDKFIPYRRLVIGES
jgi:hypothetical protein